MRPIPVDEGSGMKPYAVLWAPRQCAISLASVAIWNAQKLRRASPHRAFAPLILVQPGAIKVVVAKVPKTVRCLHRHGSTQGGNGTCDIIVIGPGTHVGCQASRRCHEESRAHCELCLPAI